MKVYIVTRGQYSDYYVDAVFLSRQEAALYIATHRNDDKYCLFNEIDECETQDGNIHANADNPVGYIYSGYYLYGNKFTRRHKFVVAKEYDIDFKNTKLGEMQVWLPEPDYDKAKKILTDRYMEEQAELHGLI